MDDPRDLRTPEQVLADAEAAGVDLAAVGRQLRMTVESASCGSTRNSRSGGA